MHRRACLLVALLTAGACSDPKTERRNRTPPELPAGAPRLLRAAVACREGDDRWTDSTHVGSFGSAQIGSDGGARLLEAGTARLLTYDRRGQLVDSLLPPADATGWVAGASLLRWRGDSLAIADATQRRVVVFTAAGVPSRTIDYGTVPELVFSQLIGAAADELLFRDIAPLSRTVRTTGLQQAPQPLRGWVEGASAARLIDTLRGEEVLVSGSLDSLPVFTTVPFGWMDLVAVVGGEMATLRSRAPSIVQRSGGPTGVSRVVWSFDSTTRVLGITDRLLLTQYSNMLLQPLNRADRAIAERLQIETRPVPLVDDLRADDAGALWVRVTRGDAEPRRTWVQLPAAGSGPTGCVVQPFGVAIEGIGQGAALTWEATETGQRRTLVAIGQTVVPP
jgi:hypothetical protein